MRFNDELRQTWIVSDLSQGVVISLEEENWQEENWDDSGDEDDFED
jgi:hypothetical protein